MKKNLLVAAMLAQPWALVPEYMTSMAGVVARWQAGTEMSAETAEKIRADQGAREARRAAADMRTGGGAIAVIPCYGVITQRGNMMDDISGPGSCSTQMLVSALRNAEGDNTVGQILIDFSTPGGSVYGVQEAAAEINRIKATKPIIGIANSMCASAGYWLMSQCTEAYCTPGGEVGSIGVWQAHEDMSKALDDAGLKITLVSAGKFKTEGNPYNPLDEDAKAFMQLRTDEYYTAFTKAVSKGRNVPVATVRGGMGQGRVLGADAALSENMIDGVMDFDSLVKKMQRSGPAKSASAQVAQLSAEVDVSEPVAEAPVAPIADVPEPIKPSRLSAMKRDLETFI